MREHWEYWRWRWSLITKRWKLAVVWALPKWMVFWCFYRVIGIYGTGDVFQWSVERVAKDIEPLERRWWR